MRRLDVALALLSSSLFGCIDLTLGSPAMLGGIEGRLDTQGHLLPEGRKLSLVRTPTGELFELTTSAGGVFVRTGLAADTYSLHVDLPGFASLQHLMRVSPGQTVDAGILAPVWLINSDQSVLVSGLVLGATANDGGLSEDAGTSDVAGARVEFSLATTPTDTLETTVVDALGRFSARVPPGDFLIRVSHPLFKPTEVQANVPVAARHALSQPIVLPLNPGFVSGTVRREVDGQGPAFAVGALVVSDTGRTAVVDQAGRFLLPDLAGGERRFTILLADHHDPDVHRVFVTPGQTTVAPDALVLIDRGTVTGLVALTGAVTSGQVTLGIPQSPANTVITASRTPTRFFLPGVGVGTVSVRATGPGLVSATSAPVRVAAGASIDVGTLSLATLGGGLSIDDGDPLNAPGVTRTAAVTLRFIDVTGATEVRFGEGALTTVAYQPLSLAGAAFTFSTGDGLKTVLAQFRTASGDESGIVQASITLDTAAPSLVGAALELQSPTLNGYSSTELVIARLRLAGGAAVDHVKIAAAATAGTCLSSDFALAFSMPVVSAYPVTVSSGDGTKGVCLALFDAAGNESAPLAATVVLDKTPPSLPLITTPDNQFLPLPNGSEFVVQTASPVSEANFQGYELLGGLDSEWTDGGATISATAFRYRIENSGAEDGTRNTLRLRARDLAGNLSTEAVLFVTADTNAPDAIPPILDEYIDHGDARATVHWLPSANGALGYRLFYGATRNDLTGTWAPEGPSPVDVGNRLNFTLTGLVNGSVTHVQVAPYDRAGNQGPRVGGLTAPARLSPGSVSPNLVTALQLNLAPDGGSALALGFSIQGSLAYVAGNAAGRTVLAVVDLSSLQSPIQGGSIAVDGGQAAQVNLVDTGTGTLVPNTKPVLADGPFLYLAVGRFLRIFGLDDARGPRLKTELDVGLVNPAVTLREINGLLGHFLVISGSVASQQAVVLVDLSSLYDDNPSTRPTPSDVQLALRSSLAGGVSSALQGTRLLTAGGWWTTDQLLDAVDRNVGTVWGADDFRFFDGGSGQSLGVVADFHRVSGNLVISSGQSGLRVTDVQDSTTVLRGQLSSSSLGVPELAGSHALTWNALFATLGVVDLSEHSAPSLEATTSAQLGSSGGYFGGTYGNYAFVLHGSRLVAFEVATARALSLRTSLVGGIGGGLMVEPGFAFTSSGRTWDLFSGPAPSVLEPDGECQTAFARFGDVLIGAANDGFIVTDLTNAKDRRSGPAAERVTVPLGVPGQRVSGVAAWGNYLVAAEVRTDAGVGDGLWLDVFDAHRARDLVPSTQFSMSDRKTEFRFAPFPNSSSFSPVFTEMEVAVVEGRAVVSVGGFGLLSPPDAGFSGVHFFDLRPLFDDEATPSFSPTTAAQGRLDTPAVTGTAVQPPWLYAVGPVPLGFGVAQVASAFDEDPLTKVSGTFTRPFAFELNGATAITVKGTRAYASAGRAYVLDLRNPLAPAVTGSLAGGATSVLCRPPRDARDRFVRNGIEPAGAFLFHQSDGALNVLNLE